VSFDASGSNDEDGFITDYAWDWDGDGEDDEHGQGLVAPEHTFMVAGEFSVRLTVTDDGGLTDTTTREISVAAPES
jgi:PKD repeat protein